MVLYIGIFKVDHHLGRFQCCFFLGRLVGIILISKFVFLTSHV